MGKTLVRLNRVFSHPIELLFEALTDPNYIVQWFGPIGMTTLEAKIQLKIGGTYSFLIRKPDGSTFRMEGTYQEINRPSKIVFTVKYIGLNENPGLHSVVTLALEEQGTNSTKVILKQVFNFTPTNLPKRTQSWESMFDRLGVLL